MLDQIRLQKDIKDQKINPTALTLNDLEAIKRITIGTVNKCNIKCPLCMRQDPEFINDGISLDYKRALKFIDRFKLNEVHFVGTLSEPTLYKDLLPFIKELKNRDIKIWISTNGHLKNDYFWEQLGKVLWKDDKVVFAVEGPTQEIHSKYRVGSSLENIINNAQILNKYSINTVCQFIKFNYNIEYLPIMKEFAARYFKSFYEIYTGFNEGDYDFQLPFKYHTRIKHEMLGKVRKPNCKVLAEGMIYMNHRNQINLCDSFDEDLFEDCYDNPLTTESTKEEFLDYFNNVYHKPCCYEYCGFKYKGMEDKLYEL